MVISFQDNYERVSSEREGRARPSIKQVLRLLYGCSDPTFIGFVEAVEVEDYGGNSERGWASEGELLKGDGIFSSGDGICPSSSSTTG
ncbi:unnamed protein product [Ilex paraguariensis]|uniref:Uncharacterized protein n=1 Tax=Ilex paraguariensis TaxID=185542 RepID=A0ABC8UJS5_9AQUA